MRQLEARRDPVPAVALRNAHQDLQLHPVLPEARPPRRRRAAAVRRHRRLRRRAGRLRHRGRRPVAGESRARLPARGQRFVARYRVSLSLKREGAPPVDLSREELVRVAAFQETLRSDESILFQQVLRILPGAYKVSVSVRDVGSTSESTRQCRLRGAQLRQRQLHRADPRVSGDGAGKSGRPALPGAQSARRGGLRQRHAARLHRGIRLRRPHHRAVPGASTSRSTPSTATRSASAAAAPSRARWSASRPTACPSASSSW